MITCSSGPFPNGEERVCSVPAPPVNKELYPPKPGEPEGSCTRLTGCTVPSPTLKLLLYTGWGVPGHPSEQELATGKHSRSTCNLDVESQSQIYQCHRKSWIYSLGCI